MDIIYLKSDIVVSLDNDYKDEPWQKLKYFDTTPVLVLNLYHDTKYFYNLYQRKDKFNIRLKTFPYENWTEYIECQVNQYSERDGYYLRMYYKAKRIVTKNDLRKEKISQIMGIKNNSI